MIQELDGCDPQDHLVAALGIVVHSPHSSLGGKSLCTSPLQAKVSIDLLVYQSLLLKLSYIFLLKCKLNKEEVGFTSTSKVENSN